MARGSAGGNQHKYAYGCEQQQFQQLGEFFTATSLKAPQRYGKDMRPGSDLRSSNSNLKATQSTSCCWRATKVEAPHACMP